MFAPGAWGNQPGEMSYNKSQCRHKDKIVQMGQECSSCGEEKVKMERKINREKKKSKLLSRVWISQVMDFYAIYGGN